MIQDHIDQIEARLRETGMPESTRAELLSTLQALKAEIVALAETHGEDAQKIARVTGASAEEATRAGRQAGDETAFAELKDSVTGFETSHPDLVAAVNRLAVILSNMGM